jgi:hypothetical protein
MTKPDLRTDLAKWSTAWMENVDKDLQQGWLSSDSSSEMVRNDLPPAIAQTASQSRDLQGHQKSHSWQDLSCSAACSNRWLSLRRHRRRAASANGSHSRSCILLDASEHCPRSREREHDVSVRGFACQSSSAYSRPHCREWPGRNWLFARYCSSTRHRSLSMLRQC